VTFTASAIIEDPFGVFKLIDQIAQHPLWECYVLPSVIGLALKLVYGGDDPISLFDK
jgi:hypothetical protein